jgi:hypothetical protein
MLELNFSPELNVGTKSGHIWYFFLGTKTKTKTKTKKPGKYNGSDCLVLVFCQKLPINNIVENGLKDL